ncbi:hypothetical protein [Bradyrhizobium sp. AUGA SZCCT0160]|uniref:hypothetical protein n=1 Tax=Bradyrhizobium sp. AUGA SZCCT0160 TaxID=2807662 RepID=UPI001BA545F2|nr:hypothetical protein [Bradyrhizobium sp. AUGA SZCCT0160]MBR1188557.1 hypothetical protein [Bradyrhizobium sp. AUGA SZCCT0160]
MPIIAFLLAGLPSSVLADPSVEIAPAAVNVSEFPVKLGVPKLAAEIALKNTSAGENKFYRLGTLLTRVGDGAGRPVTWKRNTPPVGDQSITPGSEIVLQISADLPEVGVYETFIDSYGKNDKGAEIPDRRIRIVVTRDADAIPSELMIEPKPAAETWPLNGGGRSYILTLRNSTTKPVTFVPPAVLSYSSKQGDAQTSLGTNRMPALDPSGCGAMLDAGKSCPISLTLYDTLSPGEYSVDVGLAGVGGGWSHRSQTIRVKATPFLAFAIIILGTAAGWYVQAWRSKGRRATISLVDIARIRASAERFVAETQDESLRNIGRRVLEEIDEAEGHARRDVDVAAEIDRIRLWLKRLMVGAELQQHFGKLPEVGQNILRAPRDAMVAGLAERDPSAENRTAFEGKIAAFAADLNAWPLLARPLGQAVAWLASIERLLRAASGVTDVTKLEAARDALSRALGVATATRGDTALSARVDPLQKAVEEAQKNVASQEMADALRASLKTQIATADDGKKARLTELTDELAVWRDAEPSAASLSDLARIFSKVSGKQEAAAPPSPISVPPVDLPTTLLLPRWNSSLADLQRSLERNEFYTNLLVLLGTGAAGVLTLWVPDPTWGSWGDLIGAFLAGFAARVVMGEVGAASVQGGK